MLEGSIARALKLQLDLRPFASGTEQAPNLLERARWRVFVDGLPWAIAGSFGACLAVTIAVASITDFARPATWLSAFAVVTVLRALISKRYGKPAILSRSPGFPRAALYAGNMLSGLVWGAGSFWIIMAEQQLTVSVLVAFFAAGMTAAVAASFSAVAWGFAGFTLPYLGFVFAGLFLTEHEANHAMALAVLFYAIAMSGVSRAIGSRIRNALTLWLVNKQLFRKSVAALEEANRATLLARERERTELEAKAASEAKTQFLATMSHELRTPLNAIVGFSEAMRHEVYGPLAAKYQEYATHIHESGVVLSELVGDLLELSRIELGHHELEVSTVPVADLFADVEKMFQQTPNRRLPELLFTLTQADLTINGDRRMLWQVLINLVGNAVKFSPEDSTIRVDGAGVSGDRVRLRVRDEGIGIAEEDIGRMTQAFVQGKNSGTHAQSGVGLGLSLVKAFVDLHGGDLIIESRPGTGTTVTVDLPAGRPAGSGTMPSA